MKKTDLLVVDPPSTTPVLVDQTVTLISRAVVPGYAPITGGTVEAFVATAFDGTTPLARSADIHLAVRPGTDVAVALSIHRHLFASGQADPARGTCNAVLNTANVSKA